jgi:ankyrin repeat protein
MNSPDIHKAATENNLRELKILDPELLNAKNHEGKTPLLLAIENGNSEFVQRLIRQGADVQLGDNNGVTPAHLAAYYCDTYIFTHIVADLRKCQEILSAKDNYGHDFLDYLSAKRID